MYSITDLLELVTREGAEGLKLHAGAPPVIVVHGEDHTVEGPAISLQNADQLLRSIADTRQTRRILRLGQGDFVYTFRGCHRFAVHAKLQGENVSMDLRANLV